RWPMRNQWIVRAALVAVPFAIAACSSDDNTNNPSGRAGSSNAGAAGSGNAGSGNAGSGNAGSSGGGAGGGRGDGGGAKVGVSTKETGNPFFLKMKEGAQAEADKKGATLISELG